MRVLGNSSKLGVQRWGGVLSQGVLQRVNEVRECLFPYPEPLLNGAVIDLVRSGDNLYFALKITVNHNLSSNFKVITADLGGEHFQGQT